MLGVLENHHITNSCVVVTRYFGGIKLGAGGLIRAYAGSVAQAVREIGLVEIKEQVVLGITLSYSQYQEFANFLKDHQLAEQDPMFTDQVMTTIFVDKENTSSITAALVEFTMAKSLLRTKEFVRLKYPYFCRKIIKLLSATIVFFYHTHKISIFYILLARDYTC